MRASMFTACYAAGTDVQDSIVSVDWTRILGNTQVLSDTGSSFTHKCPSDDNCKWRSVKTINKSKDIYIC
jgi:hypothetical protein